jgi:hypothetical protein
MIRITVIANIIMILSLGDDESIVLISYTVHFFGHGLELVTNLIKLAETLLDDGLLLSDL